MVVKWHEGKCGSAGSKSSQMLSSKNTLYFMTYNPSSSYVTFILFSAKKVDSNHEQFVYDFNHVNISVSPIVYEAKSSY